MKKTLILFILALPGILKSFASVDDHDKLIRTDTLFTELKNDVVVLSSTKETNSLKYLPASVSILSQNNLNDFQISSIKDLSAYVPNYYAAEYGARMTAPLYIRGIGARSGNQTVSLYVDNIPYFNTTSFDSELFDVQRVEVLRGTQGTLYGRNAMGGIVNIFTYSPLDYQGTRVKIGGGSYGLFKSEASIYSKLTDEMGVSVSGYFKRNDGRLTNHFTGNKVDHLQNYGLRTRYAWRITDDFLMNYTINYDNLKQGAFPYEDLDTGEINHNIDGHYDRKLLTNGLTFKYKIDNLEFNSITGYQHLNDNMKMDIDYTVKRYFEINQKQNQNSFSQEFTVKSINKSDYQWSAGISGFYDYLGTSSPVFMQEDGVEEYILGSIRPGLQSVFPNATVTLNKDILDLKSDFKNESHGLAVFHQSTINNIGLKGLSATMGLRLDYEKTSLKYNSRLDDDVDLVIKMSPMMPAITTKMDTTLIGKTSDYYLELLPRFVLDYKYGSNQQIYISASKGYKSGGHNIQGFADILQYGIMAKGKKDAEPQDIKKMITYKPEYSWNFELGGKLNYLDGMLQLNYSLYYMKITDVQLTQFVASMGGRLITNGGRADSKGAELSLKFRPCTGFFVYGNYGFADAKFKDYKTSVKEFNSTTGKEEIIDVDYSGNYIPFAPRATYSFGMTAEFDIKNKDLFIDNLSIDTNYNGIGKIRWNESNTKSQNFYGFWNAKIQFMKNNFGLELWGKNMLNRKYNTFVFDSGTKENLQYYGQRGLPSEFGVSMKWNM